MWRGATALALSLLCAAASAQDEYDLERDGLRLRLAVRTPERVAAFYEARGFPEAARRALAEACLLTVSLHNRRADIVWLELARWRFIDERGAEVVRLTRADWTRRWDELALPQANRSTFGWTQLPEVRDLHAGEPVGGNVGLVPPRGRFRLEARFATGRERQGPEIVVHIDHLACPGR